MCYFCAMILVSDITARLDSALDAEGFGHYTFARDYAPAISYAQEFACSILDRMLGKTRFVEERLSDLIFNGIWKTNNLSRFEFNEAITGHKLWAVVAIYINPIVTPTTAIAQPDLNVSVFAPNHKYVKSYKSAWRVTAEEVAMNRNNPFAPGNEYHELCEELKDYGYLSPLVYWGNQNNVAEVKEIEITPGYVNKTLAMQYVKYPAPVTLTTQELEFPSSMFDIILDKALSFITFKRGDTNLTMVSDADVKALSNLLR